MIPDAGCRMPDVRDDYGLPECIRHSSLPDSSFVIRTYQFSSRPYVQGVQGAPRLFKTGGTYSITQRNYFFLYLTFAILGENSTATGNLNR
jgi:hypothetical protein